MSSSCTRSTGRTPSRSTPQPARRSTRGRRPRPRSRPAGRQRQPSTSSSAPPTSRSPSAATATSRRASIRSAPRRRAIPRCRPAPTASRDDDLRSAAGVARRRPGRGIVGQRLRGDREAAPRVLLDDRLRLRPCLRARRRDVAAQAAESGRFLPPMDPRHAYAPCSTASPRSRCSSGFCIGPSRARRASRSKGSTCSCRSSTRSSAAPPIGASGTSIIGMAHRGRLNVLAHVLQKPYTQILAEFKDPVDTPPRRSTSAGWAT